MERTRPLIGTKAVLGIREADIAHPEAGTGLLRGRVCKWDMKIVLTMSRNRKKFRKKSLNNM